MSRSPAEYNARRDFPRTPEPRFEPAPAAAPEAAEAVETAGTFVIHRHEARRLHYDLRLAAGGVLVCWAVPRGFSYDPQVKHLAVRTEDHPLRYRTFEGVIPPGQYGAGTMLIWDRGSYEVVRAAGLEAALATGEVKVILRGRRLRGEWHLVRTGGADEWLLFKARDRYARGADEPLPVLDARACAAPLPRRPQAMRAGAAAGQFSDPDWIFELEFEGLRAFACVQGAQPALAAADGSELELHPRAQSVLAAALARVRAEQALLDGVLVALDAHGRPSRAALDAWAAGGGGAPVTYYAFDLLHYDEWDLRAVPLLERKQLLRALLPEMRTLLYADHVTGSGEQLASSAAAAGFHGLVAKRAHSGYRAGPQADWRRIRLRADHAARGLELQSALARAASHRRRRRARFPLSNLDKVYWPRDGYTKGDLLRFYEQVAEYLLPYLRDRPVHLNRFPDGIEGKSFFQRQAPAGVPDWVELVEVDAAHDRQFVCNGLETLIYLINLGSIELHPWLSRRGSLESPDFAVLDLDAKEAGFAAAVRVARTAGKVLRGIGLEPAVKTSGASGLHLYLPLVPGYSFDQARLFMEAVARVVAREQPDLASVERLPRGRGGKVYVDFLQNRRSATVVPPYVVRPVPGACVSMPLDWDELDGDLHPSRYTIGTTPSLLARRGDRFRATLTEPQDFAPAIERLQEYLASR